MSVAAIVKEIIGGAITGIGGGMQGYAEHNTLRPGDDPETQAKAYYDAAHDMSKYVINPFADNRFLTEPKKLLKNTNAPVVKNSNALDNLDKGTQNAASSVTGNNTNVEADSPLMGGINQVKADNEASKAINKENIPEQLKTAGNSDYMKSYASGNKAGVNNVKSYASGNKAGVNNVKSFAKGFANNTNMGKTVNTLKSYGPEIKEAGRAAKTALKSSGKSLSTALKSLKGLKFAAKSDMNLKEIYGDDITDNLIECFSKISAIDFNYKPEAQELYNGECGVDDKEHIGVIAQELQENPVTAGTVSEDENGNLEVDTRHLAFADTAAIAELSRRVLELEGIVKELQSKLV